MPLIQRNLAEPLRERMRHYPVVTVTGPRQSGKTTLCRMVFPDRPYVSLEGIDTRTYAREDPRGFLHEYHDGAVIDEVQRVPELTSYLQEVVDTDPSPGRFVLTGSQHFGLSEAVTQSLAGRVGLLYLLPPGLDELARFGEPAPKLLDTLWKGAYPRIHDRGIPAGIWLRDYFATYVERDVRSLRNVTDLEAFSAFVRMAAGRTGTEVNLSALAGDVGVRHNTIRAWLSVLEASFLVFRTPSHHRNLRKRQVKAPKLHFLDSGLVCHLLGIRSAEELRHHPLRGRIFESWVAAEIFEASFLTFRTPSHHRNLRKRQVKAPKLHFLDSGLVCHLLGIRSAEELRHHPLRGQIFESWVAAEIFKAIAHRGEEPRLYHHRAAGSEVDMVIDLGTKVILCEAKSGSTVTPRFFSGVGKLGDALAATGLEVERRLVYGGTIRQSRGGAEVVPWNRVHEMEWGR